MKERPILFSGPMVNAILEGRKTQPRRVVKNLDLIQEWDKNDPTYGPFYEDEYGESHKTADACPYGQPGDRLWVRETWSRTINVNWVKNWPGRPHKKINDETVIIYRADGEWEWADGDGFPTDRSYWKPSIHMFRADSRINLEITGVRVERLQDITEESADDEGADYELEISGDTFRERFKNLWNSINSKKHPWESNPWVWVIEFKLLPRTAGGVCEVKYDG